MRFSYQYNYYKAYLHEGIKIADYPGDTGYLPLGASDDQTGFVQGDNSWGRGWNRRKLYMVNGDVNWQLDKHNFLKVGFEARQHDIHYNNQPLVESDPWKSYKYTNAISGKGLEFSEYLDLMMDYWKNWSGTYGTSKLRLANVTDGSYIDYARKPIEFAAYIQDKVELGELVLNAGVRFDLFDPQAKTVLNKRVLSDEIGETNNLKSSTIKTQISPRLGFSFPISDQGAFHVSYGHFFQMPSLEKLFERYIRSVS